MTNCTIRGCRRLKTICEDCGRTVDTKTFEANGWVSVKDKLPHKYSRVLVTDGKKICLHYKQSRCNWEDELGYDLYCSCVLNHDRCDFVEGEITHWMPLPEPPKDE